MYNSTLALYFYWDKESMKYLGSCHCGAVQFEVIAPEVIEQFYGKNWEKNAHELVHLSREK